MRVPASSSAAPNFRSSASWNAGPTTWSPTGKPPAVTPQGKLIAGSPSALIPRANRVAASRTSSSCPPRLTVVCPMRGAGAGVAGADETIDIPPQRGKLPPHLRAKALRVYVIRRWNQASLVEQREHVLPEALAGP